MYISRCITSFAKIAVLEVASEQMQQLDLGSCVYEVDSERMYLYAPQVPPRLLFGRLIPRRGTTDGKTEENEE